MKYGADIIVFRSHIDSAMKDRIPWNILVDLMDQLCTDFKKSKELNHVLLDELKSYKLYQQISVQEPQPLTNFTNKPKSFIPEPAPKDPLEFKPEIEVKDLKEINSNTEPEDQDNSEQEITVPETILNIKPEPKDEENNYEIEDDFDNDNKDSLFASDDDDESKVDDKKFKCYVCNK